MGWQPRTQSLAIEQQLLSHWPHIGWLDLDSHGYVVIDVTPDRVRAQWWFVDGVLRSTDGESCAAEFAVERGRPNLVRIQ
jgi:alkaline phosphatase D